ncbi:hypothetical protein [Clostridium beijerinckii]|nr:hypothetical protein [Clostridium beijerinckii]MZK51448.1 hypothetical protein [Clostridium beijerinckii]MZK59648.1 hypothetical protein [Clostridium beijerinckii]MZK69768.1 hypothetical protein [Clostridium beijerinckii]MZK75146.1 hypothetical protein [Clostridium beijerinckii]MZK84858.1 hypothetical protein [Clostridium beijerinckii]
MLNNQEYITAELEKMIYGSLSISSKRLKKFSIYCYWNNISKISFDI